MSDLSRKEARLAIDRLDQWRNNESDNLTPRQMNQYERTWSNDAGRRAKGLQPVNRQIWREVIWLIGGIATLLMIGLIGAMVMGL